MSVQLYTFEHMLEWRGIRPGDECQTCHGSGSRVYGSTATWKGGIGGAAMTNDVCDKCWGSGDRTRPWFNLKSFQGIQRWFNRIAKYAP
jgi:hypothetical protein